MAQYIVNSNQNIWDVALHLFGSVEGVFDLLISNPKLSLSSELKRGMALEYHDQFVINKSIVNRLNSDSILPANGERGVYQKNSSEPLRMLIDYKPEEDLVHFAVAGSGKMVIDWDDNTKLETIVLSDTHQTVEHYFNSTVEERKIRVYGDFALTHLGLTRFKGALLPITPIIVDCFSAVSNSKDLSFLFLFDGMVELSIRNTVINDLSPIYDYGVKVGLVPGYNGLQRLDLTGAAFTDISVLDDYLEYIAGNMTHGNRRPCEVYIGTIPGQRGMDAITKILAEPAWNQEGFASSWKFYINDELYTTE